MGSAPVSGSGHCAFEPVFTRATYARGIEERSASRPYSATMREHPGVVVAPVGHRRPARALERLPGAAAPHSRLDEPRREQHRAVYGSESQDHPRQVVDEAGPDPAGLMPGAAARRASSGCYAGTHRREPAHSSKVD
jgi:hypothetical protein